MPILPEDIKAMASQRLTDLPDGGGRMSANEIVSGNVNNMFSNPSDLDWAGGRFSLRKGFLFIDTDDTDVYAGANALLSVPAADPRVSVCLFSTNNPHDLRAVARDRVESYVVKGPRFSGWLWGDQPAGARSIVIFAVKGTKAPGVGDRLYLVNNMGLSNEEYQYVAVKRVEASKSEFSATAQSSEYGATAMSFGRDIFKLELTDPLRYQFKGVEISKNDSIATNVYTTTNYNSARYYGVMKPTAPINNEDVAINVDSIFTQLVPSARSESSLNDLSLGEAGPVIGSGVAYTVTQAGFAMANGKQFHFGRGIKPQTLTFVCGGHTYTDNGDGVIYEATTQRGIVSYEGGTLTFLNVATVTATATATAVIGVGVERVQNTRMTPIELVNQGYVYSVILNPPPVRGTVMVDYRSQGTWYRLRDNGNGLLVPDISGTGTGTINYANNSAEITTAALPDVDSGIMWAWGAPLESIDIAQDITIEVAEVRHQLENYPVKPGSLTITWPTGAGTATATDNGSGLITGDATGYLNAATGQLFFKPLAIPAAGTVYTFDYDKHGSIMGTASSNYSGGVLTITLPQAPVKPGSVHVGVTVTFDGGISYNYQLQDNGNGTLAAGGGGGTVSGSSLVAGVPAKLPEVIASVPGISGPIDYVTGIAQLTIGSLQGSKTVSNYALTYTN